MKKLLISIALVLSTYSAFTQNVKVDGCKFELKHDDLTFYLDSDTAAYVSVHLVSYAELLKIDGERSDKWHREWPGGAYTKDCLFKTGFDLGHLTPSNITSYDDTLNYHSFSLFNQAPQLAAFNRGKWAQLEKTVILDLKKKKEDAAVITGVIYDKNAKKVAGTRVKIPTTYYKIVATKSGTVCYLGSNVNGLVTQTDLKTILDLAKSGGTNLGISIKF